MGANAVLQRAALHKSIDTIVGPASADLLRGSAITQTTVIDGLGSKDLASDAAPNRIGYRTHVYFRTRSEAEEQRNFRYTAFAHRSKIAAQLHAWVINRFSRHEAYASWAMHLEEPVQHEVVRA